MSWLKNNLANLFTLGNLACGFLGIVFVINPWEGIWSLLPFWLMIFAAILDFFDGFVARATQTTSTIGADLDSLADMVTFGVLPGLMLIFAIPSYLEIVGLLVPLLSAWRLAKFNNDSRGNNFFYGLPTPANALLCAGIYASQDFRNLNVDSLNNLNLFYFENVVQSNAVVFFTIIVICSILMVSDLKLLSNKIKPFSLAKAKWHLVVLLIGILLIIAFGYLGISFAVIAYVLISIIANFANSKKTV